MSFKKFVYGRGRRDVVYVIRHIQTPSFDMTGAMIHPSGMFLIEFLLNAEHCAEELGNLTISLQHPSVRGVIVFFRN